MAKPQKRTGFAQGIFAQSSTRKEEVGTLRILRDGRKFRYCKNGAGALVAGHLNAAAAIAADVMDEACAFVHAIGDMIFSETITSATYEEDYFAGGYLQINDATGEGHQYKILSSTAVAAGTSIILTLEDPIRVALAVTTSQFTISHSPYMAVIETTTEENLPIGVAPIAVTIAYYFWNQTGGPALGLIAGTPAVGTVLTLGAVAGAFAAIATALDVDVAYQAAIAWGTVGVDTEYKPVMLTLD